MTGYSLFGSVLSNDKSTFVSMGSLCLALSRVTMPERSSFRFSSSSTSSRALRKSFWPEILSPPRSSMSSSALRRSRRSLSVSPNNRIGWPLARRRRIVSSLEILNWPSLVVKLVLLVPVGPGVCDVDRDLAAFASFYQGTSIRKSQVHNLGELTSTRATSLSSCFFFSSASFACSASALIRSISPRRMYFCGREPSTSSAALRFFASSALRASILRGGWGQGVLLCL